MAQSAIMSKPDICIFIKIVKIDTNVGATQRHDEAAATTFITPSA